MAERKTNSWVRANVTLDIAVSGPWGPDATNGQMIRDAERAAATIVQELLETRRVMHLVGKPEFRIVSISQDDLK